MDDTGDFAPLLRAFMARAKCRNRDLAQLTGIALRTIENWRAGEVRHPHVVTAILKIAQVLALNVADANALLHAAGHPPLAQLRTRAQQTNDATLLTLLAGWDFGAAPADPEEDDSKTELHPSIMRHQLRAPVADFIGRTSEAAQIISALCTAARKGSGAAIAGIHGMGGVGKTELAYLVAHKLRDVFLDGQIVLSLRGSRTNPLTSTQALQAIIRIFRPTAALPSDSDALQAHYRAVLHNQRLLILADDAADVAQVRPLLPPQGCALLITSRQRFMLPGMDIVDLEQLSEAEALTFLRGICARLSIADAQMIARACGYLPLALRISGGIVRNNPALSVAGYLQRLRNTQQRLRHLRDPDDAQLDVSSSLALSYALLGDTAQQTFRQLGVFSADFTTSLAGAVVETDADQEVEELLHLLLRRNLIMYDATRERWRLHDLVRDLALNYLDTALERDATMWRYTQAAVRIVQETEAQYLAGGSNNLMALECFDAERSHIDTARCWATAHAGTPEADTLLLVDALATKLIGRLRYDVRRDRLPQLEVAITAAQRLGDQRHVGQLLTHLGRAFVDMGEPRQVRRCGEQALAIAQATGDRHSEGAALTNLAVAHALLGAFHEAIPYLEQALTIAQEQGDQISMERLLANLARAYVELGAFQQAIRYAEQAQAINYTQGRQFNEYVILDALGRIYVAQRNVRQAISVCEQALAQARAIQYRYGEGTFLNILGQALAIGGDDTGAEKTFEAALSILEEVGDRWEEATCQWELGLVLSRQGRRERALPLLRACLAYEEAIGHAQVAAHAALLARIEAGEVLTSAWPGDGRPDAGL